MFNIGAYEILLILMIALFVIKPEDFPKHFYNLGKLYKKLMDYIEDVKEKIHRSHKKFQAEETVKNIKSSFDAQEAIRVLEEIEDEFSSKGIAPKKQKKSVKKTPKLKVK